MKDQKIEIATSVFQTPQKYSNRNLELNSDEFVRHINEYEQWLRVLGDANSTLYDFPSYVRAFLFFLENKKVLKLGKVKHTHINQFFNYLSHRISDQTGKQLSSNYQKTDQVILSLKGSAFLKNTLHHLFTDLKKLNSKIISARQIRQSLISHWLTIYNLRKVQYMAGHRYVSSTEWYKGSNLEELKREINQFHPLK